MASFDAMLNLTEYRMFVKVEMFRCLSGVDHDNSPSRLDPRYEWLNDILAAITRWLQNTSNHVSTATQDLPPDCEILQNWEISANLQTIAILLLAFLTCVVGVILISVCARLFVGKIVSRAQPFSASDHFNDQTNVNKDVECQHISQTDVKIMKPMKIINTVNGRNVCKPSTNGIENFLQKTVSLLYAEINRLIILSGCLERSPEFQEQTSLHSRRTSLRRVHVSSPSFSENSSGIENDDSRIDREPWREVIRMAHKLDWKRQCQYQISDFNESSISFLKGYYCENCSIQADQWDVSCLVVNYVLLLLQRSLCEISKTEIRFVEFISSGSAKRGLKIKAANQFDVLMSVTYPEPRDLNVLYNALCDEVPPGKFLLHLENKEFLAETVRVDIGGDVLNCLSHKQFLSSAHALVDDTINGIYCKFRSLMDRLHFQIEKAHTANIVVNVNARKINGIGLKDIKIQIIPAILCPVSGVFGPCSLFAVPPWIDNDQKGRSVVGNTTDLNHHPALWSISCLEIQDLYYNAIGRQLRFMHAPGCYDICLKILKSLFGRGERKSLIINRGELSSYQIETIVCYLLLESPPKHWFMSCLPQRFSDCCQFLKKAVSCCKLPDFFIHNPHLIRQMPWLDLAPAVSGGRQNNLFKNMTNESAEKVLNFMDEQLVKSGLQSYIQPYSRDMWDYELFIFN